MNVRTLLIALPIFLMAACDGDKDKVIDVTTPPEPEDTSDSAPPLLDLKGMAPSIEIGEIAPFPGADEGFTYAFAFLSDIDGGVLNNAGCLVQFGPCLEAFPAVGETITPEVGTEYLYEWSFVDGGDVRVADQLLTRNNAAEGSWYSGLGGFVGDGTGSLSWDGDMAPYEGTDVVNFPTSLVVTEPAPAEVLSITTELTVDFAWEPGTVGSLYVHDTFETITGLDDSAGAVTLSVADLGLRAPFDSSTLVFSRINHQEIETAGSTAQVISRSDHLFQVEYENFDDWVQLISGSTVGDDCAGALVAPPLRSGDYWGDTSEATDALTLPEDNTTNGGFTAYGKEHVVPIDLLSGQTLTVSVRGGSRFDASIYLLNSACDVDAPLAGSDTTLNGDVEAFEYTAAADESVLLVLDAWFGYKVGTYNATYLDQGGVYALEVDVN